MVKIVVITSRRAANTKKKPRLRRSARGDGIFMPGFCFMVSLIYELRILYECTNFNLWKSDVLSHFVRALRGRNKGDIGLLLVTGYLISKKYLASYHRFGVCDSNVFKFGEEAEVLKFFYEV